MSKKTNRVELSEEQRRRLLEWIGRGERPVGEQRRAWVLLKADEGPEGPVWSDDQITEAFELSKGGVAGIRQRFCKRGLEGTVKRKSPDREYERKLDGEKEAELIRLPARRLQRAVRSGACAYCLIRWSSSASWTPSATRRFGGRCEPTGPKPTQASFE